MSMGESSKIPENPLMISWHDSAWIPILNQSNVMDYFSERSNPFYDRTCNNEILKMQKLGVADVQLQNMQGTEYQLLHVQEPILYVVRKQVRHSSTQVTPIADYYIVAGVVYQAPDLASLLNSRILTAVSHLQSAFEEARTYSRYHPSRGYWWQFTKDGEVEKKQKVKKEEPSSLFQKWRMDILIDQLTRQYPFKTPPALEGTRLDEAKKDSDVKSEKSVANQASAATNGADAVNGTGGPSSGGADNAGGKTEAGPSTGGSGGGGGNANKRPLTAMSGGGPSDGSSSKADSKSGAADSKRMKMDR